MELEEIAEPQRPEADRFAAEDACQDGRDPSPDWVDPYEE
jgi:hypothetical protein